MFPVCLAGKRAGDSGTDWSRSRDYDIGAGHRADCFPQGTAFIYGYNIGGGGWKEKS